MKTPTHSSQALIRKDFRTIASFIALILAVNLTGVFLVLSPAVKYGYAYIPYFYVTHPFYMRILHLYSSFLSIEVFVVIALFAILFNTEWNSATRYQALSLPKRRYSHIFFMMLVTWVAGSIVCSIPEYGIYVYYLTIKSDLFHDNLLTHRFAHYFDQLIFVPPRELFLLTGMACFAQGVMTAIKRYRLVVWPLAFFTAIAAFSYVSSRFVHPSGNTWFEQVEISSFGWEIGVIFLLIGLFLFDRYAEA
jgi:hypothetical protein